MAFGLVAVVDWDVHHGNGTQAVDHDRADTLTISVHQDRCSAGL
jgi:acetoin utilization deacetylase AcuC-like enzyme